jgi:hypothetical protein
MFTDGLARRELHMNCNYAIQTPSTRRICSMAAAITPASSCQISGNECVCLCVCVTALHVTPDRKHERLITTLHVTPGRTQERIAAAVSVTVDKKQARLNATVSVTGE